MAWMMCGMRVAVGMIVGRTGAGLSVEEMLTDYPCPERGIFQIPCHAAWRAEEWKILPANA